MALGVRKSKLVEETGLSEEKLLQRKRAEEALRTSQAELSLMLDNAPIVMMLVDPERRVRKVNGATVEFTGRPAEEMIGLRGGEALGWRYNTEETLGHSRRKPFRICDIEFFCTWKEGGTGNAALWATQR